MASSCVTTPTLTTFGVSTSQSLVTTSTESVSTGPSSVLTSVLRNCSPEPCRDVTSFITFPGNATTVTVPATLTVNVPVTVSTTLFGSSCSSTSTSSSGSSTSSIFTTTSSSSSTITTSGSTSTSTSTLTSGSSSSSTSGSTSTSESSSSSRSTSSTTSSSIVLITPPPTIITSSSLVTSDGSTFTSIFLSTSTNPVITSTVADTQSTGSSSNRAVAPGPIIGGVVGGLAALLLLGLLTWRLVKKQSKFDNVFGSNEHGHHNRSHNRSSPQNDSLLDKPSYQYGMVGLPSSNPVSLSLQDQSAAAQNVYGNNGGTGQAPGPQSMTQSTASQAAVGNNGGLSQGVTQGPVGNDGGLSQGVTQGPVGNDGGLTQATGQGATTGGHGVLGNNGGLGQAAGPSGTVGTDGGLGQTVSGGGNGVVSNLPPITHNDPSIIPLIAGIGAAATASGVYAAATSSRPSSSRPSSSSSSQPLITPPKPQGNYPTALQNWNAVHGYGQTQAGPSTSSNNDNGSRGSPHSSISAYSHSSWVGNSSTRHKMGEGSSSGGGPGILPSMGAAANSSQQQPRHTSFSRLPLQVTNNIDDEYQPYTDIGSLSFTMGASSSSNSDQVPSYDGKGRPANMLPEKAPIVHLDGSLYQQPPRGGPRSGTAPPDYME